jgi:hypothetical protein
MLYEFVKEKRQVVGCVVARLVDGKVRLSWSKCNVDAGDKFSRSAALDNAKSRCESKAFGIDVDKVNETRLVHGCDQNQGKSTITIPHSCRKVLRKMAVRAKRYFKQVAA